HIADTSKHLTAEERERLSKAGQANGFAVLDENGFIPSKNINPSVLAINTEFATITAMKAADINKIYAGELVMVTDASEDPTVESGWAIYRRLTNATDLTDLASWQKIAEKESLDVVVSWENLKDKPTSTVSAIDAAVTNSHTHANKAVLDKLSEQDGVLCYDGLPVAMAEDVTKFVVQAEQPAIETLKVGDFWYQTTGTTEI
ncbi:MAG: hypothetical protein HXL40_02890, partial [Solobacterium sp.]|nr:hypothetical protein [Solobacterium sp.]